jgi:hypothetical protein
MEETDISYQVDEENEDESYCAILLVDGNPISPPEGRCWCDLLREQPGNEVLLELGKSVLEHLTDKSGKGQDDSMRVIIELKI